MKENYETLLKDSTYIKNYNKEELERIDNIDIFLDALNEKERAVIDYHYGLKDDKMKTINEIKKEFKLSKKQINNIETMAFRKLRILFYLNNNQFIYNADTIINNAKSLLEIQQSYDNYYKICNNDLGSHTTQFYKKVIEIAEKEKNSNIVKQKKLVLK